MRVALLTHNAQVGDAIGNQVAEKLCFFLERGADVRVFIETETRLHPAVRPHCQVLRVPEPQGDGWGFLSSADLVIVEYGQYYRLLELLPLLAGGRPRVLFDYHGVTPTELWGTHNREALEMGIQQRGLVWCADAALVHSRFTCRELHSQTRFPAEWISILGHPVDSKHFCPGPPRHHLRVQLGIPDAHLLLFVGRLAPNKRLPVLIEALHRLRDLKPPVHVVIVGDSGDIYHFEAHRCREQAAELELADRVHFIGHVHDDQLLDAYRSADLLVMPSLHEGFCIPVIEAMACGLPVVAARAGALPETVADAGLTFTADDSADLARQIRRVLGQRGVKETKPAKNSQSAPPLVSVADGMRRQGLLRAAEQERGAWRECFGRIVEELLDNPARQKRDQLEVRPGTQSRVVGAGSESVLVPVRVVNQGTHAALSEGPGRVLLRCLVADELGQPCSLPALDTPLPGLLVPGQEAAAAMRVPVPATAGAYRVALCAVSQVAQHEVSGVRSESSLRLIVESAAVPTEDGCRVTSLEAVHRALVEAQYKQQLPADYIDVTQGFLAKWKRWIKRKLLGNFKHAYVDVLSRQQSAFNRQILVALQELTEICATLDHASTSTTLGNDPKEGRSSAALSKNASSLVACIERGLAGGNADELAALVHGLVDQVVEIRQRLALLEERLNRLDEPRRVGVNN